jgi:hypothetical protein
VRATEAERARIVETSGDRPAVVVPDVQLPHQAVALGRRIAGGRAEQVFEQDGYTGEGLLTRLKRGGLGAGRFETLGDDGVQRGVHPLGSLDGRAHQLRGRDLALAHHGGHGDGVQVPHVQHRRGH